VPPVLLFALVAVLTLRWWLAAARAFLADLRVAGEATPEERAPGALRPPVDLARDRTPVNKQLAFAGVSRRAAARRRWEGGFGRRGL